MGIRTNLVEYVNASANSSRQLDELCGRIKKVARSESHPVFLASQLLLVSVIVFLSSPHCNPTMMAVVQAMHRASILASPEQLAASSEARQYFVLTLSIVLAIDQPQFCANLTDQEIFRGRRIVMVGDLS